MKLIKNERGQSLVELAIILPLLLLLLMGIFEFGRIFGAYIIVGNAARDGARYGSVGYIDSQINLKLLNSIPVLDTSRLDILISPTDGLRTRGNQVTVKVKYSLEIMTPIISEIVPNPFPLEASTTMRIE